MNDPFAYLGVSRDAGREEIKNAFVRKLETCREEKSALEPKEYERRIREIRVAYEAASKIAWARSDSDLGDIDGDGGEPLSASEKLARKLIGMHEWKPKTVSEDERQQPQSVLQDNEANKDPENARSLMPVYCAAAFAAALALLLFFCLF